MRHGGVALVVCALVLSSTMSIAGTQAFIKTTAVPGQCPVLPTLPEVNAGQAVYQDRYLSSKAAAKLGIPVANLTASRDYLVIIRDYKRSKECTSSDGKTRLVYGQVIRAVIEVVDTKAGVSANLASIAAEGTLSRRNQYFYLYKDGIANPKIDAIIAGVSGKVFDVENYALYQSIMPQMIELMSKPETTLSVNLLDVLPAGDDPAIVNAAVTAFALSEIARGRSCSDSQTRFPNDAARRATVRTTYEAVAESCDSLAPNQAAREFAKNALSGLKVR